MKKHFLLLSIVLVSALFCFANSASAEDDFFGYYYIQNAPKAFADISEIHLAGTFGAEQKPPVHGLIRLKRKSAKDFKVLKPIVNGKSILFSTTAVGGISYKFTGEFTKMGNFPELQPEGEVLLKGTLQKFNGKTKIAEAKLNFTYSAGD